MNRLLNSILTSRSHLLFRSQHRQHSLRTRVVHGGGARGRDVTMSTGSPESQYGLRHISGVPAWNGNILSLRDYETTGLWYGAGLKPGEQDLAVAHLWANLLGPAKEVVGACKT